MDGDLLSVRAGCPFRLDFLSCLQHSPMDAVVDRCADITPQVHSLKDALPLLAYAVLAESLPCEGGGELASVVKWPQGLRLCLLTHLGLLCLLRRINLIAGSILTRIPLIILHSIRGLIRVFLLINKHVVVKTG